MVIVSRVRTFFEFAFIMATVLKFLALMNSFHEIVRIRIQMQLKKVFGPIENSALRENQPTLTLLNEI